MSRATVILFALIALSSCTGEEAEIAPSWEISMGQSSISSVIKTLAIRPAYTKIVGIGKTVPLTVDVWLWDGGLQEDATQWLDRPDEAPLPIEWGTQNFGIASVDGEGVVTAVSSGETLIIARIDGEEAAARIVVQSESSLDPSVDTALTPP